MFRLCQTKDKEETKIKEKRASMFAKFLYESSEN